MYIPTVEQVKDLYHLGVMDMVSHKYEVDIDNALAQYDASIKRTRAEAWAEGLAAGNHDTTNPYEG